VCNIRELVERPSALSGSEVVVHLCDLRHGIIDSTWILTNEIWYITVGLLDLRSVSTARLSSNVLRWLA